MNINPMQLMQLMKSGNPQQMIINLLNQQAGNNPVIRNALNMVQSGDFQGVETLARNMAKEKGIDADNAVSELRKQFGI